MGSGSVTAGLPHVLQLYDTDLGSTGIMAVLPFACLLYDTDGGNNGIMAVFPLDVGRTGVLDVLAPEICEQAACTDIEADDQCQTD